ncbi:MAG: SDR family NAD(P)-dependent oxidoreductase [Rhodoglobus sp.]
MSENTRPLTGRTSIEEWLAHPVGGPLLTGMLAQGGQDASSLDPVKSFPLDRLVGLSQGKLPQAAIDGLVLHANDGVMPVVEEEEVSAPSPWVERITPGRFDGQTIIVTGAGSGIGRATASRIAREGGRVIAADISEARLAELAAELPECDVVTIVGDIAKSEGVAAIVGAAGEHVHGLANIAGIMDDMTPLHEVSDEVWERVFSVNVDGMFRLTRAVLPLMLADGYGSIVNVASEAGIRGSAAGLAYTASKHAVVGMTKSSAFMYTPKGIRVNAVAPGPVATNIQASFASTLGQERIGFAMQVLPGMAEAIQLAASITFLLSHDGTNVSGAILPSDGGWSAL